MVWLGVESMEADLIIPWHSMAWVKYRDARGSALLTAEKGAALDLHSDCLYCLHSLPRYSGKPGRVRQPPKSWTTGVTQVSCQNILAP